MSLFKKSLYYLSRIIDRPLVAPDLLIISLTECCNLRCPACGIKKDIAKESLEIDMTKTMDVISQAQKMKIGIVVLSGGEPFLVEEIFPLIEFIKASGMNVAVTTNGFWQEQLAEKIAHSPLDHLHFSFDGLNRNHDELRGKGSYERMMNNISLIRKIKPIQSMGFGTVIYNKNCNDLFEMTKIADSLKINIMNFIPYLISNVDPQHSKKGPEYSQLWPDARDLLNLKDNFKKIFSFQYKNLKVDFNPGAKLLLDYYSNSKINKKCFAGYKSMIITSKRVHNGSLASDVFFCQDSCGNVYETSLKEAWSSEKARHMRRIAKRCPNTCLQFCHYI